MATPPRATGDPRLAYAEFLLRVNDDRSTVDGLNRTLAAAAEAEDMDAVRTAAVAILDFVDLERDWLQAHPPADCYAAAHASGEHDARGVRHGGRRFVDWTAAGGGLDGLAALGGAADAATVAGDALDGVRRGARDDTMPRLTPRLAAARPPRDEPPDRGRARRGLEVRDDRVVGEAPLEIRAAGPRQDPVAVAVTMRTPGHEAELAVGFLRTEGLLEGPRSLGTAGGDPASLSQPDDTIVVRLSRPVRRLEGRRAPFHRDRVVRDLRQGVHRRGRAARATRCRAGPVVSRAVILALPDLLRAAQRAFDETGGLHAAGLFSPSGELIAIREDVGRHNALDKLVGSQVLAGRCRSTSGS